MTPHDTDANGDPGQTSPGPIGQDPTQIYPPAAPPTPPARPTVPGFEVLGLLGRGGMGVVYEARQATLNRIVALKMLLERASGRPETLRFLAEADALASVKHPNVVQVFGYGEHEGGPYLAMEFLPGGSLLDRLKLGKPPFTPFGAAREVEKLARAVQAAHDQGIVHRDMKPANVLYDEAGEPKVTDFGLAKRSGHDSGLTATLAIMGTPAYMSPEQASGRTKFVGPACDIHALGVILYECLTGTKPFEDENAIALYRKVAQVPPERPGRRAAKLPRDIELICLKCLEKDPRERYPTAGALADDLAKFIAGEPVSVRAAGVVEKGYKWARRNPTLAAAYVMTLAVLLLVGVGASLAMLWRSADRERRNAETAKRSVEFLAELDSARIRRQQARPGWVVEQLAALEHLANNPASADRQHELRSEALAALVAPDFAPGSLLETPSQTHSVAWHPSGRVVAAGERGVSIFPNLTVRLLSLDGEPERRLAAPTLPILKPNGSPVPDIVTALAFSPSGLEVAAGCRSGRIYVWDASHADPKPRALREADDVEIETLVFAADDLLVAQVKTALHSYKGGRPAKTLATAPYHAPIALGPDGAIDLLAENAYHRLDPETLAHREPTAERYGNSLVRLGDGGFVVRAGPTLSLHETATAMPISELVDPALDSAHEENLAGVWAGRSGPVLALSETSRRLAAWDLPTGRRLANVPVAAGKTQGGLSPDGTTFALARHKGVQLYRFSRPIASRPHGAGAEWVRAFAVEPRSGRIVTATSPPRPGNARVRRLRMWEPDGAPVGSPRDWPDDIGLEGDLLAFAGDRVVFQTHVDRLEWRPTGPGDGGSMVLAGPLHALTAGPGGEFWLAVGEMAWKIEVGESVPRAMFRNTLGFLGGRPQVLAVSPTGDGELLGCRDGHVRRVGKDNQVHSREFGPEPVPVVAGAAGLAWAVACDDAGRAEILDAETLEAWQTLEPLPDRATAAAIDPRTGLVAMGSGDGTVRLGHVVGRRYEPWADFKADRGVMQLALSPDGRSLYVLFRRERAVQVWSIAEIEREFARLGMGRRN